MVGTARSIEITKVSYHAWRLKSRVLMYSYATRGLGFLVRFATISRKLGQGRQRSGGSPLFMINHRSSCNISQCSGGMQEWVIQIPSIPILVSVLFPSLHLRIKFLLLVCIVFMRMRTKPYPHPVIS